MFERGVRSPGDWISRIEAGVFKLIRNAHGSVGSMVSRE